MKKYTLIFFFNLCSLFAIKSSIVLSPEEDSTWEDNSNIFSTDASYNDQQKVTSIASPTRFHKTDLKDKRFEENGNAFKDSDEQGDPFMALQILNDTIMDHLIDKYADNDPLNSTPTLSIPSQPSVKIPIKTDPTISSNLGNYPTNPALSPIHSLAIPDCTKHTLLVQNGDSSLAFNPEVMNPEIFQILTLLMQYMYQSTKRITPDQLMYPGNFGTGPISPIRTILNQMHIRAYPFFGTNGRQEGSDVGLIAYRIIGNRVQIFIILEGSQGEPFELFGGKGGASWMTNLQANKKQIQPSILSIPANFNAANLSFHEGFFLKIFYAKRYFERILYQCLEECHIIPYNPTWMRNMQIHTPQELKHFIDTQRGLQVEVYIAGHSQGGGLTQVAAPYITSLIGQYLYGPLFDNKIFNIAHAICFSPARAIGDDHTLTTINNVMGRYNIIGYCSPLDVVPCVPLGHNIGKDKLKELATNLFLKLGKWVSKLLPEGYREVCNAICSAKNHYETLQYWAYEDPVEILDRFCTISIREINKYLTLLSNPNTFPWDIKHQFKDKAGYIKAAQDKLLEIKKIQQNLQNLKKLIHKMQEHYFKAHTSNVIISNYHAFQSIHYLKEIFKICPPGIFIAAQHFGPFYCYIFEYQGTIWICLETAFSIEIIPCPDMDNFNAKIKNTFQYDQRKESLISQKR